MNARMTWDEIKLLFCYECLLRLERWLADGDDSETLDAGQFIEGLVVLGRNGRDPHFDQFFLLAMHQQAGTKQRRHLLRLAGQGRHEGRMTWTLKMVEGRETEMIQLRPFRRGAIARATYAVEDDGFMRFRSR